MVPPIRLVLVHSPLVGPGIWEPVARLLADGGDDVRVPDLRGTLAAGPPYCSRQAAQIARAASGGPAALIGHSGAGSLLAEAGSLLDQVRGCVFVDAGLPIPGQSWLETAPGEVVGQVLAKADPDGWLPPWPSWWGADGLAELIPDPRARRRFAADCPRLPLAMFEERRPPSPGWRQLPGAYLRLSDAYDGPAAQARALGWPVVEHQSHHLAPITHPALVAESIRRLLRRP